MNDKVASFFRQPWVIPAAVGIASFGAGVGLGYFLGSRMIEEEVFEEIEEEKAQLSFDFEEDEEDVTITFDFAATEEDLRNAKPVFVRDDSLGFRPKPHHPKPDPSTITVDPEMQREVDAVIASGGDMARYLSNRRERLDRERKAINEVVAEEVRELSEEDDDDDEVESIRYSVFANTVLDSDWDYDVETANRSSDAPYVIHRDEFFEDETDCIKSTLTYYVGDDILTDDQDVPIANYVTVTGPMLFGHGSGDPNVFYVRNERHDAEYEIILDHGSYSVEILGLEAEEDEERNLRHSKLRKFKMDD